MIADDTYERELAPWEIEERKKQAFTLLDEHDGLGSTIEQHQRQVRTLKLRQATVDSRVRLLRHEISSGKTLVDRQAELPLMDPAAPWVPPTPPADKFRGIDGMTDDPAPEIDPPGALDVFARMYPMARTIPDLWIELCGWALDAEQQMVVMPKPMPPAGSPGFDAIANWSRTEKARKQGQERMQRGEGGIPGLYIPTVRMPKEMADLLKPAPKKRGVRPLSSPSPDLPATPPAKKTRKRSAQP